MDSPEYLICLNCETPCYTFEFADGKITEAMCLVCGVDDLDEFLGQEDYDLMIESG